MTRQAIALLALLLAPALAAPASAQSARTDAGTDPAVRMDAFGYSVVVLGDEVLVAEPRGDRVAGAVYVYRRTGSEWGRSARITASDAKPGDGFGTAIGAEGSRMLVGAPAADDGRGALYVFRRNGADWTQTARLQAADGAAGDSLGTAVAVEGDLALVTAAGADSSAGRVYVFRHGANGWAEAGQLAVEGQGPEDRYGRALALSGGTAFVNGGRSDSTGGAVWAFPSHGNEFAGPTKLAPADAGRTSRYGAAMAAKGDLLLVGAPGMNRFAGAVYAYRRHGGDWTAAGTLTPPDDAPRTLFGAAIGFADGEVWVGAPGVDDLRGAVYRVPMNGDQWGEPAELTIDSLERGDFFGGALAVSGNVAVLGIPGADFGQGTATIFSKTGGAWQPAKTVMGQVVGMDPITGPKSCAGGKVEEFTCSNVDLLSFIPVENLGGGRGVELNDVWGWTDPETHHEYALVGRMDGTAFVDVTDPENPVYVGQLPKTEGSSSSVWRDIKTYKNHAYVVSDNAGEHGVQIFDLTRLRDVQNPPETFTEDAHYSKIHSAHNIVIDTDTGYAYTVGNSGGGETCGGGLHMIDIRDPENPQFAGCFADPSTGRQKTGYTHDAECVVYHGPDADYQGHEICFGSNETALSIADVTDKANPVALAAAEYPNVGYTHQAWLTADQKYLFLDDELDEMQGLVDHTRTLIWDVSDLDDPVLVKEFFNPNTTAIDHNLYINGDKVYQSNYVTGLRILDIRNVTDPHEVGFFDTDPFGDNSARFDGTWSNYPFFKSGTIVVTSMKEGLFLLKYHESGDKPIS